jgi:hypothetical protein
LHFFHSLFNRQTIESCAITCSWHRTILRVRVSISSYDASVIGNIEIILRIYDSKMFSLTFLLFGIFTFRRFNISTFLFFGTYIF